VPIAADTFRPFSPLHGGVVVGFALIVIALVLLRRALDKRGTARALDSGLAALAIVSWICGHWWVIRTSETGLARTLPLHVCHIVGFIVPFALIAPGAFNRAILYYWGLGLSSQGFFTPDLRHGPAHIEFWLFWINHFTVCGAAIYDLAARGYRPGWRDFAIAALAGIVYVAIVFPIDMALDANYGYVGPRNPTQPSLMDWLPRWPWRVFVIVAAGVTLMAVMTIPWTITQKSQRRKGLKGAGCLS
jgi:hypothetical integral membrane protein (TIGR02206 family)